MNSNSGNRKGNKVLEKVGNQTEMNELKAQQRVTDQLAQNLGIYDALNDHSQQLPTKFDEEQAIDQSIDAVF